MRLDDALDRYVTQLRANGRSEHTVLQVQRHVRLLAAWLAADGNGATLDDIDSDVLARFLTADTARLTATRKPKTPGSMNALRSSLKRFFGHAVEADWVAKDPTRLIKRAICSPPPPRALTEKEERQLRGVLEAAHGPEAERDRVLTELMLATGVRLSSALGLEVGDVDLDDGVLLLRHVKGGRVQRVFLNDHIRTALAKYLSARSHGPVFQGTGGRGISARHAQRRFRRWKEMAGIGRAVSPHSLRHGFAMRLYRRTSDLLLVQAAMGHASISSTLVYAKIDQGRIRAAVTGHSSLSSDDG